MKLFQTLLAAALLTMPYFAEAQTGSACIVPANLQIAYDGDVRDLAVRRLYEVRHPDTARIAIPALHTDSIWRGLAAIFNSTATAVDSVFAKYCVHNSPAAQYRTSRLTVAVQVDPSYSWTNAWQTGSTVTGYGALDSFVSRYAFSRTGYYVSGPLAIAYLTPAAGVNCRAFADSIRQFTGVLTAYSTGSAGDGDFMLYSRDTVARYAFRVGYGDCPAGCTAQLYWAYHVNATCNTTLDSIRHSAGFLSPPPPVNCGLIPPGLRVYNAPDNAVSLHPNPATAVVRVVLSETGKRSMTFSIRDAIGRIRMSGVLPVDGTLDVSTLSAGVYVLSVKADDRTTAFSRFIKK